MIKLTVQQQGKKATKKKPNRKEKGKIITIIIILNNILDILIIPVIASTTIRGFFSLSLEKKTCFRFVIQKANSRRQIIVTATIIAFVRLLSCLYVFNDDSKNNMLLPLIPLPFNFWSLTITGLVCVILMTTITNVCAIDCFKCVSYNGANKACDDPFHNNYSTAILESPCMGGRKGRDGLFPATACIKIAGYYDDTGETITVRGCALDSGTLTTDTEIIRMSHCGKFYYDDRYVHGCLQSCSDADACNTASQLQHISTLSSIRLQYLLVSLLVISVNNYIVNIR